MRIKDRYFYIGAAATSAAYSIALEKMNKTFEPDFTWLTVMGGVALTGSWKGAMTRWGEIPAASPQDVAWHTDWRWVRMFWATGLPVIAWQLWQLAQRRKRLLRYIQGE